MNRERALRLISLRYMRWHWAEPIRNSWLTCIPAARATSDAIAPDSSPRRQSVPSRVRPRILGRRRYTDVITSTRFSIDYPRNGPMTSPLSPLSPRRPQTDPYTHLQSLWRENDSRDGRRSTRFRCDGVNLHRRRHNPFLFGAWPAPPAAAPDVITAACFVIGPSTISPMISRPRSSCKTAQPDAYVNLAEGCSCTVHQVPRMRSPIPTH